MLILLVLIPILAAIASTVLYHQNGKRQVLNFDIVQFVYSFVLVPVMFVWLKSFLFFIVKSELGTRLSFSQFFVIDTTFSVIFLFVSFFVVIHSLTKSFELQRLKDPLKDIFELSEYFHHTLSHSVIFIGSLTLASLLSLANMVSPITALENQDTFYWGLVLGLIAGIIFHVGILQYDTASRQFLRLMKLVYGLMFLFEVTLYFLLDPPFSAAYGLFWFVFAASATLVVMGIFAEPIEENARWWRPFTLNPRRWVSIVNSIKYVVSLVHK